MLSLNAFKIGAALLITSKVGIYCDRGGAAVASIKIYLSRHLKNRYKARDGGKFLLKSVYTGFVIRPSANF